MAARMRVRWQGSCRRPLGELTWGVMEGLAARRTSLGLGGVVVVAFLWTRLATVHQPPLHPEGPRGPVDAPPPSPAATEVMRPFVEAVREGRDPSSVHLRAFLEKQPEDFRQEAVSVALDAYAEEKVAGLMPVLRAHPESNAGAIAVLLRRSPAEGLEAVATFLFPGGRPDAEAWKHEGLRAALIALCERSGDPEADIEAGAIRAKALWLAGKARLKEAVPAIKKAAGIARDEKGRRLPGDPHGSCLAMARKIIDAERRRPR